MVVPRPTAEKKLGHSNEEDKKKVQRWLEAIIFRYFHIWTPINCQGMIKSYEIAELCLRAREFFWMNRLYREVDVPVKIVGDIHGQFEDLRHMFNMNGWPFSEDEIKEMGKNHYGRVKLVDKHVTKTFRLPIQYGSPDRHPGPSHYLFLGDYVDRGTFSLDVVVLLFALQLRYPERITLLRGNHESRAVNKQYGFYNEVMRRYSEHIYEICQLPFYTMPLTAIVNKRIMCMHGGISETLHDFKQLDNVMRPFDIPDVGIIADLTWADPDPSVDRYQDSPRGAAKIFGVKAVEEFCSHFDLDLIVRAHQVVQDGYEFFANRRLVTIFSAPYYCSQTFNVAAVLHISKDMVGSFSLMKPVQELNSHSKRQQKKTANVGPTAPTPIATTPVDKDNDKKTTGDGDGKSEEEH
ncbi:unnamed protein product [Caenorhabditis auriculariae]|uniref:Serine/threonine-protein phosphatase n=1 Tax=Caenorhabditis auriculariae TaxID=2777116 RepID=A0A8S1H8J6_9PELO|nr:unnamed protein product [Caenorhabditis auriculariae]